MGWHIYKQDHPSHSGLAFRPQARAMSQSQYCVVARHTRTSANPGGHKVTCRPRSDVKIIIQQVDTSSLSTHNELTPTTPGLTRPSQQLIERDGGMARWWRLQPGELGLISLLMHHDLTEIQAFARCVLFEACGLSATLLLRCRSFGFHLDGRTAPP